MVEKVTAAPRSNAGAVIGRLDAAASSSSSGASWSFSPSAPGAPPDRLTGLPPYVWYQDMVDFSVGISDRAAGDRLERSLQGKGAFRRFKNELYQRHPELISVWHAFRDARARARAVHWLAEEGLVDEDAVQQFERAHPDPDLP